MNFHVLMPFYRKHLTETIKKHLKPMNVIWHPICDEVDIEPFKNNKDVWIKPCLTPKLIIPGETAYKKINDFVDRTQIIDEDYYGFLGDDDMYVPGFIDTVKNQYSKVIFFSASRGDVHPPNPGPYNWPPVDLEVITLDDIRVANVDFCQMIVKGEVLKQCRFGEHDVCDDGRYAENLKKKWSDSVTIFSKIGVNKNYFQPGRYINNRGYNI